MERSEHKLYMRIYTELIALKPGILTEATKQLSF